MKQTLFLFVGLFLLSIALSGCGETQDAAGLSSREETQDAAGLLSREATQDTTGSAMEESSGKRELILAGIDFNASHRLAVTTFNQASDNTIITLRDYGDNSGVLAKDSLIRVYRDIASGDIADMYLMSPSSICSIESLVAQDVFVDLYPFLDDDPAISRDDFFATLLETVQQDDALFCFPINYALKGIWGLPEYSDSNRFPIDRIPELHRLYPENDMLFGALSAMELIDMELSQNLDLYVNWETRECDFTSERFLNVLEAAYHLPQYRPADRDEMIDYVTGVYLLEGRQFFAPYTVSGFEAYLMMTAGVDGEVDVVFNPYDSDMVSMTLTDSEVVLDIGNSFAISSTCSDPDTAWQFLRTFLELEYQQSLPAGNASLPINVHAFTAETDGLLAEGKGTEAGFGRILELIESAKAVSLYDSQIPFIVNEEVSAYFSDEKTAEEVAGMIQGRVSAYLAEY